MAGAFRLKTAAVMQSNPRAAAVHHTRAAVPDAPDQPIEDRAEFASRQFQQDPDRGGNDGGVADSAGDQRTIPMLCGVKLRYQFVASDHQPYCNLGRLFWLQQRQEPIPAPEAPYQCIRQLDCAFGVGMPDPLNLTIDSPLAASLTVPTARQVAARRTRPAYGASSSLTAHLLWCSMDRTERRFHEIRCVFRERRTMHPAERTGCRFLLDDRC